MSKKITVFEFEKLYGSLRNMEYIFNSDIQEEAVRNKVKSGCMYDKVNVWHDTNTIVFKNSNNDTLVIDLVRYIFIDRIPDGELIRLDCIDKSIYATADKLVSYVIIAKRFN